MTIRAEAELSRFLQTSRAWWSGLIHTRGQVDVADHAAPTDEVVERPMFGAGSCGCADPVRLVDGRAGITRSRLPAANDVVSLRHPRAPELASGWPQSRL